MEPENLVYTEYDEIRKELALSILHELLVIKDGDTTAANIGQIIDLVLSNVDLSNLSIFIIKPVKSIVENLPIEGRTTGDRHFATGKDYEFQIGEWNGASWIMTTTKVGDSIYCYADHKYIVRTIEGWEYSTTGNIYYHPNHSGDVTSNGDGGQTIAEKAVTLAKMANIDSGNIIYRRSDGNGPPELQTLKTLKADLGIITHKPVLSFKTGIPEENNNGYRFFITEGSLAFSIIEFIGDNWVIFDLAEGDYFYCYSLKSFIVRTKTGYEIALGNSNLPDVMTPDVMNEPMIGIKDGVNQIFSTANDFVPGSLVAFVNGANERYFGIESANSIRFDVAPTVDSIILAIYRIKV